MNERKNDMNTDNVWTSLAVFGHARISGDLIDAIAIDWGVLGDCVRRWVRNQLNREAALEGVSLRINTNLPDGRLDIYLRKFGWKMPTNAIWIALATFGNVKIPLAHIYNEIPSGFMISIESEIQRIRAQLNAEAIEEGVSLRIKSYFGGLDVSLRKFNWT